jgi:DEAD/DEAH box helicase domain-containing protein
MKQSLESVLTELESDPGFTRCVTRWEKLPGREGTYVPLPVGLHPRIAGALREKKIDRLYSHQARAFRTARDGKNLVVVTPTASGKTLCYNLPVLQEILENPESRALYLFPTKALSQDQQSELNEAVLLGELGVKVSTYDGDTPSSLRVSARETGQIVISNPDMLHAGILPNHPKWIKFLKSLR